MPRLFVAIRPPPAVRTQLLTLRDNVIGARWQDDVQLHLTLRFIGEIDAQTADEAILALRTCIVPAFEIMLAGVGMFDRRGLADTLWVGVSPHAPLAALHRKIDHALVRIGLPPERRAYKPHVTIARGRMHDAARFVAAHTNLISAPFTVNEFTLFESILTASGAFYDVVERYALC